MPVCESCAVPCPAPHAGAAGANRVAVRGSPQTSPSPHAGGRSGGSPSSRPTITSLQRGAVGKLGPDLAPSTPDAAGSPSTPDAAAGSPSDKVLLKVFARGDDGAMHRVASVRVPSLVTLAQLRRCLKKVPTAPASFHFLALDGVRCVCLLVAAQPLLCWRCAGCVLAAARGRPRYVSGIALFVSLRPIIGSLLARAGHRSQRGGQAGV